ncbi:ABC transporter substrate-binding protein [Mesorhizobium ventifaucium]|uniref:Solute-binding protein family 5 domain-containing protein n=1 Tax=Mesorhizobium ventifaucium TaxID=666020 RepID=A0ABM9DFQ9_9HYPH|nr:hypothetical protein MES4922_120153 [Mesorhizobium ventifaucium]
MSESEYKLRLAQNLIGRGKVSRRDFIQLGLKAGLTVAAADTLFVSVARAEPQRGGFAKLGMAHGATTDSIDPAGYPDTFTQTAFSGAMSNSLTEVDAKGSIQPDLAESFETSDEATTWVFKLRKGATFHNGKTVTADDVGARPDRTGRDPEAPYAAATRIRSQLHFHHARHRDGAGDRRRNCRHASRQSRRAGAQDRNPDAAACSVYRTASLLRAGDGSRLADEAAGSPGAQAGRRGELKSQHSYE